MKVRVKYSHWYPKTTGIGAVVIYPYVLFSEPKGSVSERTYRHELEHVLQIKEHGALYFYVSYLFYMLAGIVRWRDFYKAYRANPYEVEAFNRERNAISRRLLELIHEDHHEDIDL